MERTTAASSPAHSTPLGDTAVVIGGSLAGLLAGRVLAQYFGQVTIIERDALPDEVAPRKGVPQGRHAHGLLGMGQQIMGQYFPGLFEELRAQGATPVDLGYDTGWFQAECWRARTRTGMIASLQSRPFLEGAVRRRVRALPNVRFLTECDATGLQTDAARGRITGVHIHHRSGPVEDETLPAALVVDAGGRGSRTPQWLEELGYGRVEEVNVKMDVAYTTRFYRIPANFAANWKMLIIIPQPPHETRMGLMLPMEGHQWMVSLVGWLGDHAPTDEAGFLEFARTLPVPDVYNAIKDAEPVTPIAIHKIPSNQWRHYEKMARFPEGLVSLGDALCSFNPTYGQGMTTAALYVETLDKCLAAQARRAGSLDGLADRFRKQVAKVVATPWLLATVEDFRYPQTTGQRPPPTPFLHWYLGKLYRATEHDPRLVAAFLQVMHMFRSPASLFMPPTLLRVLTGGWRVRPVTPPATPEPSGKAVSA